MEEILTAVIGISLGIALSILCWYNWIIKPILIECGFIKEKEVKREPMSNVEKMSEDCGF